MGTKKARRSELLKDNKEYGIKRKLQPVQAIYYLQKSGFSLFG